MAKYLRSLIPLSQLIIHMDADDHIGLCLSCGEEAYEVEPDARAYECDFCDAAEVYGVEEMLLSGFYEKDKEGHRGPGGRVLPDGSSLRSRAKSASGYTIGFGGGGRCISAFI